MKGVAFFLFLMTSAACFAQSSIEGYILDKSTNEPLPFATINLIKSGKYTITNEDGKFEIKNTFANDSLRVTHIGYESVKIPLSYFLTNFKLFMVPFISELDEITVVADKDYAYKLLNHLIRKYRNKESVSESKAFLSLTSSANNTPLEHIEGFYNSKQSLSDGIIDLKIKSGRFGQNKSFPFYSLDNTTILRGFQLFKSTNHQILPFYPGNITFSSIKRKYIVKVATCISCSEGDISISFIPKRLNGRLFFGKILFNKETLIIKKIELGIKDPVINELSSIIKKDVITFKEIQLNILFNPIDLERIQYLDFTMIMYYNFGNSIEIIKSDSFLYFYDYDNSFEEPYFTSAIHFNNDYDKIIALQATDDFWDSNYQFPKSYNENNSLDFMKKFGYLINYNSTIPSNYIELTKPSVISWSKEKRLEWKNVKQTLATDNEITNRTNIGYTATIKKDKMSLSVTPLHNKNPYSGDYEKLNFSYMLDLLKNKNGSRQFITRTIFDRNSSFYSSGHTKNKLVYLNLIFDIYEYHRQSLMTQITDKMTFEKSKNLCKKKFVEASMTVEKMKNETNSGKNYQSLTKWNTLIKSKLNIDNFALITNNQ
ncbi:MAG: carboxypeptidase-like regulatory domain-containing protein [Aureibaculum sp.]|nr:carboxypeptidase-like regulatory domain-containing protein [Aureibaculum sp.]